MFLSQGIYAQLPKGLKSLYVLHQDIEIESKSDFNTIAPKFEKTHKADNNFGFDVTPTWVMFQFSDDRIGKAQTIGLNYPPLDSVEFYLLKNGKPELLQISGDMILADDDYVNNYPTLNVIPQKINDTFLVKISTVSSNQFWLTVENTQSFIQRSVNSHSLYAIFYGILTSMLLYNLFVFLILGYRTYIFYAIYLVTQIMMFASINGHLYEFILSHTVLLGNTLTILSISLLSATGMIFSIVFLRTKESFTFIYRVFLVLITICILIALSAPWLPYKYTIKWSSFMGAVSATWVLFAAIKSYIQGNKAARFFVLSWTIYLLSLILLVVQRFGILGNSFFVVHVSEFGALIETLLITLALIDQMHIIRKENLQYTKQIQNTANELKYKTIQLEKHAHNLSHVLRKPIANIIGLIDIINNRQPYNDDSVLKMLDKSSKELDEILKEEAAKLEKK
jgi:hypothetical protein